MAVTLAANIDATQQRVTLTEPLIAEPGDLFRIGDEAVEFGGYGRIGPEMRLVDHSGKTVIFQRGVGTTDPASHLYGVAVLRVVDALASGVSEPAPWSGSGAVASVNGQTGVVVLDAGDVGADASGSAAAAQAASQPLDAFLTDLSGYSNFSALVDALKPYFLEPD